MQNTHLLLYSPYQSQCLIAYQWNVRVRLGLILVLHKFYIFNILYLIETVMHLKFPKQINGEKSLFH